MIYYYNEKGRITRCVQAPIEEAPLSVQEGEQWIQNDSVINDSTHFIFNETLTPFPESPGLGWIWDWTTLEWSLPVDSLNMLKNAKKVAIDMERDRQRYSGVVYNGISYDSDVVSSNNLVGWVSAINAGITLPEDFTWRSADNQNIPFTENDVLSLASAMILKTTACYQRAWALKAELDALIDYQDIKDFDSTTGWPE